MGSHGEQLTIAVWARIAEITEIDQPDQAVAALKQAIEIDPVNEELYQRLMRIHGRQGDTNAVRATPRRLSNRPAEVGDSEPSQPPNASPPASLPVTTTVASPATHKQRPDAWPPSPATTSSSTDTTEARIS